MVGAEAASLHRRRRCPIAVTVATFVSALTAGEARGREAELVGSRAVGAVRRRDRWQALGRVAVWGAAMVVVGAAGRRGRGRTHGSHVLIEEDLVVHALASVADVVVVARGALVLVVVLRRIAREDSASPGGD